MSELAKRSITGFFYVVLLLSAAYFGGYFFEGLFLTLGIIGLFELKKLLKLNLLSIGLVTLSLLLSFVLTQYNEYVLISIFIICIPTYILLLIDLFKGKNNYLKRRLSTAICYTMWPLFIIYIPYHKNADYYPVLIVSTFVFIWINDSMAYIIGKRFGKHKLFPSVSPKKSIEGFIGGAFFSLLISFVYAYFYSELTLLQWNFMAIIIILFGTFGDLIESKFKRDAKVKDSGTVLIGHGGFLDRLDSLIFLAPFLYITIQFFNYVS